MASPSAPPAPAPAATPEVSIDVTKDLESLSALKTMLSSQQGAVFTLLGELTKYSDIQQAANAGASAKVALSGTAKAGWKTGNGISFSLTPQASCSISVASKSTTFAVAMNIESAETTKVVEGPMASKVYVNIELDFDIQGSLSGSGSFNGVGVAGKASGSKNATLVFCQPVDASLPTLDALKKAFSGVVFPLDPACAVAMTPGALAKVSFDGAIDCELDVTYGLGNYQVSSSSVANALSSLEQVAKITPPSIEIKNAGAKGAITYRHADHFGLVVDKISADSAILYLVRSGKEDWGASVGVTAGITVTTAPSVTVDQAALQETVQQITGSTKLASSVLAAVSPPVDSLESKLNTKLKTWATDGTGQAGVTASLKRQQGHVALFTFKVDATQTDLARASWAKLVGGSVADALQEKGMTLESGSGICDSLQRSCAIQIQFSNLFQFTSTTDAFSNTHAELGPDGTIRIFSDIGKEQEDKTKNALDKFRIHFVATATEGALKNIADAEVDLHMELSEKGNAKEAAVLANAIGTIPGGVTADAQHQMRLYAHQTPKGTLNLIAIIKASAYRNLASSAYDGKKPMPLPHEQDLDNWKAFQAATEALVPDFDLSVQKASFALWVGFNVACNGLVDSRQIPDRRHEGNSRGSQAETFLTGKGFSWPNSIVDFLVASAQFMNLCEDLQTLARKTPQVDSQERWDGLLKVLTTVVTDDFFLLYAKPTAGALLAQCCANGAQVSTAIASASDSTSITCTVTLT